jgi:hypothetical protein
MASAEIETFRIRFEYEFDRLLETIAGLDDEAVNWKPPVSSGNSLLVLVTHALASAEDNVVRRAAGKTVLRNRDAEFAVTGGASHLIARMNEVRGRIADAPRDSRAVWMRNGNQISESGRPNGPRVTRWSTPSRTPPSTSAMPS